MTGVPSQTRLRIVVVGAGRHAAHHVAAIGRCAGATVVGIVDPASDAARALAESCGARAFGSLGECLAAGPVDVVHVVTPPTSHGRLAREALDGGAHVYVEKPFTETSREAGALLDLAASRRLLVCSGHQLLFEPPSRELARRLPSVGRPAHVESYFAFRPVRRAPGGRAPLRSDLQLLDILPHPTYLLLDILERSVPEGETELAALELSGAGTLHALVRRGGVTGVLTVTLEGRPVESYLRVVGRNGAVTAEYVRGTVQRLIGPGSSGPDKVAAPYRTAWQLGWGSTGALARRLLRRQRSYPGLAELFGAFYDAVRAGGPSPVSPGSILDTVRICERAAEALAAAEERTLSSLGAPRVLAGTGVVITGGTGFLGRELVRAVLARGRGVRVIARRLVPLCRRQLARRVVRRRVAPRAILTAEDCFASRDEVRRRRVRVPGRFQRQQVDGNRIEDLVRKAITDPALAVREKAMRPEVHRIGAVDDRPVARDVLGMAQGGRRVVEEEGEAFHAGARELRELPLEGARVVRAGVADVERRAERVDEAHLGLARLARREPQLRELGVGVGIAPLVAVVRIVLGPVHERVHAMLAEEADVFQPVPADEELVLLAAVHFVGEEDEHRDREQRGAGERADPPHNVLTVVWDEDDDRRRYERDGDVGNQPVARIHHAISPCTRTLRQR